MQNLNLITQNNNKASAFSFFLRSKLLANTNDRLQLYYNCCVKSEKTVKSTTSFNALFVTNCHFDSLLKMYPFIARVLFNKACDMRWVPVYTGRDVRLPSQIGI